MHDLVNTKKEKFNSTFIKEVGNVLLYLFIFQILFAGSLYAFSIDVNFVQYINYSTYTMMFLLSAVSLKYTIANKPLVSLFVIEFFVIAAVSLFILISNSFFSYNFSVSLYRAIDILLSSATLLITAYMFFYSISPKASETKNHIIFSIIITAAIIILINFNIVLFADFANMSEKVYEKSMEEIALGKNYVYIINLSFLLFIWFTYNQGQYLLSEYLPSILAMHTLMIVNEIYQWSNYAHYIQYFINAQYFNAIVNIGFVFILFIRLNYLSNPKNIKNEKYVLNYDLLKGYVQKPNNTFLQSVLTKLGKQTLYFGSIILFVIICIPLFFLGDLNYFMRFNVILMLLFLIGVMIYAIVNTQRKWFNHVGFLIRRKEK